MVAVKLGMPTKLKRLSIYLEPEIKEVIDKMADREQRSVANMISVLIRQALEERGAIPKQESN